MLIFLIAAPIAIIVVGPAGIMIGEGISAFVYFVQAKLGFLAVGIMGALWPLLVITGMHRVFTPTILQTISETGMEGTVMPSEIGANLSLGGVSLAVLANAAQGRALTGLEFASGIPGSVGGGVVMNAGAYGGEMAQVLVSVTALDLDGSIQTIPAESCGLGYRRSVFSDGQRLVLEARFQLSSGDPAAIRARMDELAARRKEKQPLEYPSAGSMFKRPEGYFAAAQNGNGEVEPMEWTKQCPCFDVGKEF